MKKLAIFILLISLNLVSNGYCEGVLLRISTGEKDGMIFRNYGTQLADCLKSQNIQTKLYSSKGSIADLNNVVNGYAEIAIVSENQYYCYANMYLQGAAYLEYIGNIDGISSNPNQRIGIVIQSTLPLDIRSKIINSAKRMLKENMKK